MSAQGFIEERTPFFAIRLPAFYTSLFPEKAANLARNAQQLTTPLDIHATLRELTCTPKQDDDEDENEDEEVDGDVLSRQKQAQRRLRSQSLLSRIEANRTCEQIGSQKTMSCLLAYSYKSS